MNDQSALFSPLAKCISINGKEIVLAKSTTSAEQAIATVVDFIHLLAAAPTGAGYIGIPSDVLNQEFSAKIPAISNEYAQYLSKLNRGGRWGSN